MASILTPQDSDRLIERCVRSLPGEAGDPLRLQQETATEIVVDELAMALSQRQAPSLSLIEERMTTDLGDDSLPAWLSRSRVVLVVRDALAEPGFRKAAERLPARQRYGFYREWAGLAASLYRDFPDEQIAGKPAVALSILAGPVKSLRKALAAEMSMELHGRKSQGWWSGLRDMVIRNRPDTPRRPTTSHNAVIRVPSDRRPADDITEPARGDRPGFDANRGIRRPSGTPRLNAKTDPKQTARKQRPVTARPTQASPHPASPRPATSRQATTRPAPSAPRLAQQPTAQAAEPQRSPQRPTQPAAQATAPAVMRGRPLAESLPRPGNKSTEPAGDRNIERTTARASTAPVRKPARGLRAFEATIADRFAERGLAPIAVTAAASAAVVMAELVQRGEAPDFYEVEYEVLARSGEAVAPGAVRTWTLHAFMECMRDEWFRDLFHALPSQARAETVWTWAKAAAEWFDVPVRLREFWVRALSGGDPVLAAAAARAFAAKTPQLPTRPAPRALTQEMPMPAPARQEATQERGVQEHGTTAQTGYARPVQMPASAAQLIGQNLAGHDLGALLPKTAQPAMPADSKPVQNAPSEPAVEPPMMPATGNAMAGSRQNVARKAPAPTFRPALASTPRVPPKLNRPATGALPVARPSLTQPAPVRSRPAMGMPVQPQGVQQPTAHPSGTSIFERRTPRPETASNAGMARPLPKRVVSSPLGTPPMPASRPAAITPLGAADIYYGPPGGDESPLVPRDLSRMETIGNGD